VVINVKGDQQCVVRHSGKCKYMDLCDIKGDEKDGIVAYLEGSGDEEKVAVHRDKTYPEI
jgi:hypothetical protein